TSASAVSAKVPIAAIARETVGGSVASSSDSSIVSPVTSTSGEVEGAVAAASLPTASLPASETAPSQRSPLPGLLPGGATLNYLVDGYYGYDFNHPLGRVQYLRAYDVLSNAFSINQAGIVLALDPSVTEGRRYGVRLDLQFGQATGTLQGNPANEPRP